MTSYLSYFRIRLITFLQYRTSAIAGLTTQVFFGLMYLLVYRAFYLSSDAVQSISYDQLVNFLWLNQIFFSTFYLFTRDSEIFDLIRSGNIAYELCRPQKLYPFWYMKLIAGRIASFLMRSWPILIVALLMPEPYRFSLPANIETFLIFMVMVVLALILITSISLLIHIIAFLTINQEGIISIMMIIGELLTGAILPLPFMPTFLYVIAYIMPFRLVIDLPFRTYAGNIPFNEALIGIVLQIAWILTIILLGYHLLNKILKKVVIQGG